MFGKNSHTIHDAMKAGEKVQEPQLMNPAPLTPVSQVACGAWHSACVTGLPGIYYTSILPISG